MSSATLNRDARAFVPSSAQRAQENPASRYPCGNIPLSKLNADLRELIPDTKDPSVLDSEEVVLKVRQWLQTISHKEYQLFRKYLTSLLPRTQVWATALEEAYLMHAGSSFVKRCLGKDLFERLEHPEKFEKPGAITLKDALKS